MRKYMAVAIAACCVGILAGWLLRSGQSSGGVPASVNEAGYSNPYETDKKAHSPTASPPRDDNEWRAIASSLAMTVPASRDEEDEDDRMERRGIIMAQSAEEVRQAIIENAALDEGQVERLDEVIGEMNREMLEVSTKWADAIRETGTLDMDMRLRMQHDINGVSVAFSDLMDAEFPGWRASVPASRDEDVDLTRLVRVTTAFEPFRKIRGEILRGEMGARNTETTEIDTEEEE